RPPDKHRVLLICEIPRHLPVDSRPSAGFHDEEFPGDCVRPVTVGSGPFMTRCSSELSVETDPPGDPRTGRPVGSGLGFGVRGPDLVPIGVDRHEDTEAFAGEGIDEEFPPVAGLHHQTPVHAYSSVPTLTASA